MRILLTNDDGIAADGLVALAAALEQAAFEVWVVAPDQERSACSHAMSLGRAVEVRQVGERRFAHSGAVADGVYYALVSLLSKSPPDLVVSGINRGANLAEDVIYSGTVAGARESVLRGVTGVAISLTSGDGFAKVAKAVPPLLTIIAGADVERATLWNVNFPPPPFSGPVLAPLGHRPYQPLVRPAEAANHFYLGGPPQTTGTLPEDTDVMLVRTGVATVTPLVIDQTDHLLLQSGCLPDFKSRSSNE